MQQENPPSGDKNTAWDQKLNLSGDNFGFGPVPSSNAPPMVVPQQKSGSRRTCLLIIVALLAVCVLVCLCGGLLAYQTRELVLVTFYHQTLQQNQNLDVVDINLICAGSQAEIFHEAFLDRYPRGPIITISGSEIDDDTKQVHIEGSFEYAGETSDYNAIYTIDSDGDFLYVFGCISEIRQILPPLIPPLG